MKYICDLASEGGGITTYLKFSVDKTISKESIYLSWDLKNSPAKRTGPEAAFLYSWLYKTSREVPGICTADESLLLIEDNRFQFQVVSLSLSELEKLRKELVKRIHAQFFPGETCRRVKREDFRKIVEKMRNP